MIKYRKQLHEYDCGPIALYNCLLDDGLKVDYKYLKKAMIMKYDGVHLGTRVGDFLAATELLNYKVKRSKLINPSNRQFIIYQTDNNNFHYVYINDGYIFNYSFKDKAKLKINKKILANIKKKWYVCWRIQCGELTLDRVRAKRKRAASLKWR